jgi:hypothetical protein
MEKLIKRAFFTSWKYHYKLQKNSTLFEVDEIGVESCCAVHMHGRILSTILFRDLVVPFSLKERGLIQ